MISKDIIEIWETDKNFENVKLASFFVFWYFKKGLKLRSSLTLISEQKSLMRQ